MVCTTNTNRDILTVIGGVVLPNGRVVSIKISPVKELVPVPDLNLQSNTAHLVTSAAILILRKMFVSRHRSYFHLDETTEQTRQVSVINQLRLQRAQFHTQRQHIFTLGEYRDAIQQIFMTYETELVEEDEQNGGVEEKKG